MFRRGDGTDFDGFLALGDNAVGSLRNHLFQEQSQMCVWPVICRSDVFDAIRVG